MRVVCAWCEREGRPPVLRVDLSREASLTAHGLCEDHSVKLLYEIRTRLQRTWTVGWTLATRAAGATRLAGTP